MTATIERSLATRDAILAEMCRRGWASSSLPTGDSKTVIKYVVTITTVEIRKIEEFFAYFLSELSDNGLTDYDSDLLVGTFLVTATRNSGGYWAPTYQVETLHLPQRSDAARVPGVVTYPLDSLDSGPLTWEVNYNATYLVFIEWYADATAGYVAYVDGGCRKGEPGFASLDDAAQWVAKRHGSRCAS